MGALLEPIDQPMEEQGFPQGLANHEIEAYFGLDSLRQIWIRPRSAACPEPSHHGAALMEDEKDYAALLPLLYPKENIEDACRQAMALKPCMTGVKSYSG